MSVYVVAGVSEQRVTQPFEQSTVGVLVRLRVGAFVGRFVGRFVVVGALVSLTCTLVRVPSGVGACVRACKACELAVSASEHACMQAYRRHRRPSRGRERRRRRCPGWLRCRATAGRNAWHAARPRCRTCLGGTGPVRDVATVSCADRSYHSFSQVASGRLCGPA